MQVFVLNYVSFNCYRLAVHYQTICLHYVKNIEYLTLRLYGVVILSAKTVRILNLYELTTYELRAVFDLSGEGVGGLTPTG